MKSFLKFLGTVILSVVLADGLMVGHMLYETSQYFPPPTLEQKLDNVVSVYTDAGYCSGWVLKGSHTVVTAAHCAEGLDPTTVIGVDFGDGIKHPFHIQKIGDPDVTTAPDLMTLTTSDASVHWPVGMAVCAFKPYYGEVIDLIGGPLGRTKSITFGRVAYPDRLMEDISDVPFDHFIQYDGALEPGNSGGPAVDDLTGCVIGVGEMSQVKMVSGLPFFINYLTAASLLKDLK